MSARTAGVTGIATYVPEGRMTPEELAAITGIPAAVVRDKLGLHGRVVPTHDDQPTAMAVTAARLAHDSGSSPCRTTSKTASSASGGGSRSCQMA